MQRFPKNDYAGFVPDSSPAICRYVGGIEERLHRRFRPSSKRCPINEPSIRMGVKCAHVLHSNDQRAARREKFIPRSNESRNSLVVEIIQEADAVDDVLLAEPFPRLRQTDEAKRVHLDERDFVGTNAAGKENASSVCQRVLV